VVPFCGNVETSSQKFGDVYCHQIIKAAKQTQIIYLNDTVNLCMNKNKFILILNCWEGQPNPTLYNEKFLDLKTKNELSSSVKTLLSKCSTLYQPCNK
jgi:hypothetical protein